MSRLLFNDSAVREVTAGYATRAPLAFHKCLPGYEPTPLRALPELAARLGLGQILLKDESSRFGLPAFKILGASWAVYRSITGLLGHEPHDWSTIDELAARVDPLRPLELVTATDGNHGRAVARVAAWLGFGARIFVPRGTVQARIDGIESEGATVIMVDGTYDEAVARAADSQSARSLMIQDTSWPGYEEIPGWVIEGYSTIFWEIEDALAASGERGPDVVIVQVGVGALAAAVVSHYRRTGIESIPRIVSVEPTSAACALAAFEQGRIVTVPGPHDSIMAGLNCGTLATGAWPLVRDGIDCFMGIDDERARQAMREFATCGIVSGESGAASLATLLELTDDPDAPTARQRLDINSDTRVLIFLTEGATDPAAYEQIVGRTPAAVRKPLG